MAPIRIEDNDDDRDVAEESCELEDECEECEIIDLDEVCLKQLELGYAETSNCSYNNNAGLKLDKIYIISDESQSSAIKDTLCKLIENRTRQARMELTQTTCPQCGESDVPRETMSLLRPCPECSLKAAANVCGRAPRTRNNTAITCPVCAEGNSGSQSKQNLKPCSESSQKVNENLCCSYAQNEEYTPSNSTAITCPICAESDSGSQSKQNLCCSCEKNEERASISSVNLNDVSRSSDGGTGTNSSGTACPICAGSGTSRYPDQNLRSCPECSEKTSDDLCCSCEKKEESTPRTKNNTAITCPVCAEIDSTRQPKQNVGSCPECSKKATENLRCNCDKREQKTSTDSVSPDDTSRSSDGGTRASDTLKKAEETTDDVPRTSNIQSSPRGTRTSTSNTTAYTPKEERKSTDSLNPGDASRSTDGGTGPSERLEKEQKTTRTSNIDSTSRNSRISTPSTRPSTPDTGRNSAGTVCPICAESDSARQRKQNLRPCPECSKKATENLCCSCEKKEESTPRTRSNSTITCPVCAESDSARQPKQNLGPCPACSKKATENLCCTCAKKEVCTPRSRNNTAVTCPVCAESDSARQPKQNLRPCSQCSKRATENVCCACAKKEVYTPRSRNNTAVTCPVCAESNSARQLKQNLRPCPECSKRATENVCCNCAKKEVCTPRSRNNTADTCPVCAESDSARQPKQNLRPCPDCSKRATENLCCNCDKREQRTSTDSISPDDTSRPSDGGTRASDTLEKAEETTADIPRTSNIQSSGTRTSTSSTTAYTPKEEKRSTDSLNPDDASRSPDGGTGPSDALEKKQENTDDIPRTSNIDSSTPSTRPSTPDTGRNSAGTVCPICAESDSARQPKQSLRPCPECSKKATENLCCSCEKKEESTPRTGTNTSITCPICAENYSPRPVKQNLTPCPECSKKATENVCCSCEKKEERTSTDSVSSDYGSKSRDGGTGTSDTLEGQETTDDIPTTSNIQSTSSGTTADTPGENGISADSVSPDDASKSSHPTGERDMVEQGQEKSENIPEQNNNDSTPQSTMINTTNTTDSAPEKERTSTYSVNPDDTANPKGAQTGEREMVEQGQEKSEDIPEQSNIDSTPRSTITCPICAESDSSRQAKQNLRPCPECSQIATENLCCSCEKKEESTPRTRSNSGITCPVCAESDSARQPKQNLRPCPECSKKATENLYCSCEKKEESTPRTRSNSAFTCPVCAESDSARQPKQNLRPCPECSKKATENLYCSCEKKEESTPRTRSNSAFTCPVCAESDSARQPKQNLRPCPECSKKATENLSCSCEKKEESTPRTRSNSAITCPVCADSYSPRQPNQNLKPCSECSQTAAENLCCTCEKKRERTSTDSGYRNRTSLSMARSIEENVTLEQEVEAYDGITRTSNFDSSRRGTRFSTCTTRATTCSKCGERDAPIEAEVLRPCFECSKKASAYLRCKCEKRASTGNVSPDKTLSSRTDIKCPLCQEKNASRQAKGNAKPCPVCSQNAVNNLCRPRVEEQRKSRFSGNSGDAASSSLREGQGLQTSICRTPISNFQSNPGGAGTSTVSTTASASVSGTCPICSEREAGKESKQILRPSSESFKKGTKKAMDVSNANIDVNAEPCAGDTHDNVQSNSRAEIFNSNNNVRKSEDFKQANDKKQDSTRKLNKASQASKINTSPCSKRKCTCGCQCPCGSKIMKCCCSNKGKSNISPGNTNFNYQKSLRYPANNSKNNFYGQNNQRPIWKRNTVTVTNNCNDTITMQLNGAHRNKERSSIPPYPTFSQPLSTSTELRNSESTYVPYDLIQAMECCLKKSTAQSRYSSLNSLEKILASKPRSSAIPMKPLRAPTLRIIPASHCRKDGRSSACGIPMREKIANVVNDIIKYDEFLNKKKSVPDDTENFFLQVLPSNFETFQTHSHNDMLFTWSPLSR